MSDIKGISILIPVFNFDIRPLVKKLSEEASSLKIPSEIRCYDDGSKEEYKTINREIKGFEKVIYVEIPANIGRSSIRNLLAKEASFQNLLFIDSDSRIPGKNYIEKYINAFEAESIIGGGTIYKESDNPEVALRYTYGKKREEIPLQKRKAIPYGYINLNNLFIPKNIYLENQLDESINTYGHEDTKFADHLRIKKVKVIHIDNPVVHAGLESNEVFLAKSKEAINNFYKIIQEGYGHHSRLYKAYQKVNKPILKPVFLTFFGIFEKSIEKNLKTSTKPSLILFDLYKLNLLLRQK